MQFVVVLVNAGGVSKQHTSVSEPHSRPRYEWLDIAVPAAYAWTCGVDSGKGDGEKLAEAMASAYAKANAAGQFLEIIRINC